MVVGSFVEEVDTRVQRPNNSFSLIRVNFSAEPNGSYIAQRTRFLTLE